MRKLHSKEAAVRIMQPHLETLEQCLRLGWNEWEHHLATSPNARLLSTSARARFIYDFTVHHARRLFQDVPDVRIDPKPQFLTLIFGNEFVIRFKKLNAGLEWSGIPTLQQQLFECQEEIEGLPDRATFLVAGYVLNETGTRIARLVLTCRDAVGLRWSHDLGASAGESGLVPMPAPMSPLPQQGLRSKVRTEEKEAQ